MCAAAGVLQGLTLLRRAAAEQQADDDEHREGDEQHHDDGGEAFAQAQVRQQGDQTDAGGQSGDGAEPTTHAGRLRHRRRGCRRGALRRRHRLLRRYVALHAGAASAADALGLGVGDQAETECGDEKGDQGLLHSSLLVGSAHIHSVGRMNVSRP